jgi:ribose transport system permease protein
VTTHLASHQRGPAGRLLAAILTPGGAVYVLAAALLVATIQANPNFGDPGVLMLFLGRTAPIAIAAIGQYYVIVSGEFDLSMGAVIGTQVVLAGNLIGDDPDRIVPVTAPIDRSNSPETIT